MSDLSPLTWAQPTMPGELSPGPAAEPARFRWPTPPYAAYPEPREQDQPEPCEIIGLNNSRMIGRVILMVPEERLAQINIPPARTTLGLKFAQFSSMKLLQPLRPRARLSSGMTSEMELDRRPRFDYTIRLKSGAELNGTTIGHVEDDNGLFLFSPIGENDDTVLRVFVPREVVAAFEVGTRIGELLVEESAATAEEIEEIAQEQQTLRARRVGDILVNNQVVTADQLLGAIEQQARMPMVRIGEALLAMELVSSKQLDDALDQQRSDRSVPLGELLVRKGVVSRQALQSALARKMGYPLVDVDNFPVEADAIRKLPFAAAKRLEVLPLLIRDGRLIIALEDPTRRDTLDEVEFITQMKIVPTLTKVGSLHFAMPTVYERFGGDSGSLRELNFVPLTVEFEPDNTNKLIESLEREQQDRPQREEEKPLEQSDNSLVRLINTMIIEASNQGVSDIHIETHPGREKVKIRFRKDGLLYPYLELPYTYRNAMIARIKIMCDLDISERRKPQDGKINFAKFSSQHKLELRVATIPTNNGLEDLVMRLLASARPIPLDSLGLSADNLGKLKDAVSRPYGMVLCVGPTGSGKTTTLHSALSHINVPERKIWTAEDPIEITQAGLRQVQVNPKIDWTFAKALRAFLRADPDVIMVGEIRDEETAQMAIEASLTGHMVMSTLHTNSAPETVTRLLDMGMDPFNFADSLLAVLAQRLVRRICKACRHAEPLPQADLQELLDDYRHVFTPEHRPKQDEVLAGWMARFGQAGKLMRYRGQGCAQCDGSGFKGRVGLHELLVVSKAVRRMIQTGARAEELQDAALSEGMRVLRQDGIEKVLQGDTTLEEVRAMSNA
jgi:type II secretory ATPase GspE/PulE/Tfp pilus assembly ATPase PilB-like protein